MHKRTLLILALLLLVPPQGHAQSDAISIAPCLPENAALIRLEGTADFGITWQQVVKDIPAFYALEGEPIEWLGYSPKGQEYKEALGVEYGFGGVDMRLYGEQFLILIYDAQKRAIGRIEVHEYQEQYIIFMTTLNIFGLSDGSRNAYHVFAVDGMACMFFIQADDFEKVLKWD